MARQSLYRFELAFCGEEQGVGFLQGLDDTPLFDSMKGEFYHLFDSLPVPPILETPDDSAVMSWFTEKGLAQYAEALNSIIYELSAVDWQIIGMVMDIDTDESYCLRSSDALYADEYQMVFSYSDVAEATFGSRGFREVSRVEPESKTPLVFIDPKPSLDALVSSAEKRRNKVANPVAGEKMPTR